MFLRDVSADVISSLVEGKERNQGRLDLPKELVRVSLANPNGEELLEYGRSFLAAGENLPVVYPYFAADEGPAFKLATVKRILNSNPLA